RSVYDEPYQQPAAPEGIDIDGLLRGLYRYRRASLSSGPKAQIIVSGVTMLDALRAQELLAEEWGVAADVWSATSWTELRREAVDIDHDNLLNPADTDRVPYVTRTLQGTEGAVVAASDWMRAVAALIRAWVANDMLTLGTDGFGCSEPGEAARRGFNVDAESITVGVLSSVAHRGDVHQSTLVEAARKYRIDEVAPVTQ